MITQPGPRDWLPATPPRARTSSLLSDPRPPRNHALGAAFLSVLFGTAAIVFAVAPLIPGATGGRFVISTVGLTAVFAGFRSFHLRRGRPAMGASVLSTIGIGSGAVATLLMVVTWASFQSVPGLVAQPLPQR